ncbi:hypothetical protein CEXT_295331 [Caerostris extrusa]|uniref:Uncharacterized protein n=1 Tax=Caerostris extrusa TaxID=172846 RepID=A0AAV4VDQ2_CAEEX|nr:hypothetical protein CEXT_295331 [Caerostris extrusa]
MRLNYSTRQLLKSEAYPLVRRLYNKPPYTIVASVCEMTSLCVKGRKTSLHVQCHLSHLKCQIQHFYGISSGLSQPNSSIRMRTC